MKPYWTDAGTADYFTNPKYIVGDHIWASIDGSKTYVKVPIKEKQ